MAYQNYYGQMPYSAIPNFQAVNYNGQPQIYPPINYQQIQNNSGSLYGKVVDMVDVARAADIPMGGYGIFPKADMSEIYIKAWNNDGTTKIITFRPTKPEQEKQTETNQVSLQNLASDISSLNAKIDKILSDLCN